MTEVCLNFQSKCVSAFSLCSIKVTVVADAGRSGSSCLALRSPVTVTGTACALGMGRGACRTTVCSRRVGTKKVLKNSAPTIFLALEKRDVTEGVKWSGTADETKHAAGPSLTGPVAPLITLTVVTEANSKYYWKAHYYCSCEGKLDQIKPEQN